MWQGIHQEKYHTLRSLDCMHMNTSYALPVHVSIKVFQSPGQPKIWCGPFWACSSNVPSHLHLSCLSLLKSLSGSVTMHRNHYLFSRFECLDLRWAILQDVPMGLHFEQRPDKIFLEPVSTMPIALTAMIIRRYYHSDKFFLRSPPPGSCSSWVTLDFLRQSSYCGIHMFLFPIVPCRRPFLSHSNL